MAVGDAEKRHRAFCEDDLKRRVLALEAVLKPDNANPPTMEALKRRVDDCQEKYTVLLAASRAYIDKLKVTSEDPEYLGEQRKLNSAYAEMDKQVEVALDKIDASRAEDATRALQSSEKPRLKALETDLKAQVQRRVDSVVDGLTNSVQNVAHIPLLLTYDQWMIEAENMVVDNILVHIDKRIALSETLQANQLRTERAEYLEEVTKTIQETRQAVVDKRVELLRDVRQPGVSTARELSLIHI